MRDKWITEQMCDTWGGPEIPAIWIPPSWWVPQFCQPSSGWEVTLAALLEVGRQDLGWWIFGLDDGPDHAHMPHLRDAAWKSKVVDISLTDVALIEKAMQLGYDYASQSLKHSFTCGTCETFFGKVGVSHHNTPLKERMQCSTA